MMNTKLETAKINFVDNPGKNILVRQHELYCALHKRQCEADALRRQRDVRDFKQVT